MASPDGHYRIEADEFSDLLRAAKAFDRDLGLRLRRNIREAAKPVVEDVKSTVLQDPPNDRPGTVGTRAAIAKGVSLRVSTAASGGKVTVAGSSKYLPEGRKQMLRLYNKEKGWRHPVFDHTKRAKGIRGLFGGRDAVWVHQQGRPYFGSVIEEHKAQLRAAVEKSLNEAAAALGRAR